MNVMVACEFSGIVREAFRKRGHNAWSCDLRPSEIPSNHIQGDFLSLPDSGWDLLIAFPPCTHLSSSGARWWETKQVEQRKAIYFFLALSKANIPRICIENPIGIISTIWRKPNQIIQPWQFGHGETKATCLWLKDLPLLIPTQIVEGRYPRTHLESPGPERQKNRSRTYQGVADAMADQWSNL